MNDSNVCHQAILEIAKDLRLVLAHNEFVTHNLTDKEVAREFLNASLETYLEDGDVEEFLRSLELVIKANPLLTEVGTHLQKASPFGTIVTLLSKLGLRLKIA